MTNAATEKELHQLIASAKDAKEIKALLHALLTPAEYDELVTRWQIIKLLAAGKPQRDIRDQLAVSIATVTRGARELKYGTGILKKFYSRLYSTAKT